LENFESVNARDAGCGKTKIGVQRPAAEIRNARRTTDGV